MENGISVNEAGQKMGLKPGDKILKIDGKPALSFNNSAINMLFADQVTVMREGKEVTFDINKEGVGEVLKIWRKRLHISKSTCDSRFSNCWWSKRKLV